VRGGESLLDKNGVGAIKIGKTLRSPWSKERTTGGLNRSQETTRLGTNWLDEDVEVTESRTPRKKDAKAREGERELTLEKLRQGRAWLKQATLRGLTGEKEKKINDRRED